MDYIANVENSEIDVSGIRTVLVQGDSSYPVIRFVLDPSLTGLSWRVRGTYTDSNIPVISPEIVPVESATEITLDWSVSSDFTACYGNMQLVVVGANDSGTVITKALGEVTIQRDYSIGTMAEITLNLFEQLFAQTESAISTHNSDTDAHQSIQSDIRTVEAALQQVGSQLAETMAQPKLQISQVVARYGPKNYGMNTDYYPFRAIHPTFDTTAKNTGAIYALGGTTNNAAQQDVFRSYDGGKTWAKLGTIAIAAGEQLMQIFVEPYYETILILKQFPTTPKTYKVLTYTVGMVKTGELDIGTRYWHASTHNVDASSIDFGTRVIMFAEYCSDDAPSVRVWKSSDKGITWTNVFEIGANNGAVNTGAVRHFHVIQVDPFTKHWWLGSGDTDAQSKIWRSQDNGVTWELMYSGTQAERTLTFVFEEDYIYYGMDSPHSNNPSKVYRISRATWLKEVVATIPNGHAIYAMTKTFYPRGFICWTAYEVGSTETNEVGVYFYDYATNKLTLIYLFDRTGITGLSFGVSEASRYQDRETGNIYFKSTLTLFRTKYGYGGDSTIVSEVSRAQIF